MGGFEPARARWGGDSDSNLHSAEMSKPRAQIRRRSPAASGNRLGLHGVRWKKGAEGEEARPARNIVQTYLDTSVFLSRMQML